MDLMQRTDAWHRARRGKLTASAMGCALGLTPWSSPRQLARQLRADMQPETDPDDDPGPLMPAPKKRASNPALEWGTKMEPNGILEFAAATGCCVEPTGLWEHPDLDWIGGSPDGLVNEDGLVEVKCPYNKRCYTDFPVYYYCQVNCLLECTGREWCDLFCWTPTECKIWRVRRSKDHWDYLLNHYINFWAAVVNGGEPPNPGKKLKCVVEGFVQENCTEIPLNPRPSAFQLAF